MGNTGKSCFVSKPIKLHDSSNKCLPYNNNNILPTPNVFVGDIPTLLVIQLQERVKNAEDERDSLTTAIRLLFEESYPKGNQPNTSQSDMITVHNNQRDSVDCTQQTSKVLNPDIQTRNRFTTLKVEENISYIGSATENKTDHNRAGTDNEKQTVNATYPADD
jgi:hypothetical protein